MRMANEFRDVDSRRFGRGDEIDVVNIGAYGSTFLKQSLSRSEAKDVYVKSPLYYAFTGRNGLWYFQSNGIKFVGCVHPNDNLTRLLFMPFVSDQDSFDLHINAIASNLQGGDSTPLCKWIYECENVHIARVPKRFISKDDIAGGKFSMKGFVVEVHRESKLDWMFPSYDVSLQSSAYPVGPRLSAYRNKLNKFRARGIDTVVFGDLMETERVNAIQSISERWVENKLTNHKEDTNFSFDYEELLAPYQFIANLTVNRELPVDGIFLKRGNEYLAFWLWENNRRYNDPVPCLAALQATSEPGCCEYLHYQAARRLLDSGYKEMCIGGSESEGLNLYKQKFAPVRSHELCTLKLVKMEPASARASRPKDGFCRMRNTAATTNRGAGRPMALCNA